ncbi:RNA polymerase sigma factor [Paenibacillus lentus]|uniref:Sigma-70 family RNA polymerase sigma factor n=1 Tax=Paenibacillus lentus TaxID=1338368 RepID=A0A3S8RT90_9BACL|nr:sigma-70 family RNA polymerase sigma factor [Paenibacillus lentus]AZK45957.1 sigma-70 family RNA polymerase sigma factor [Paenibacillus lentus]
MILTKSQRKTFNNYYQKNESVFSNGIVSSFFQNEENIVLLLKAVDHEHKYLPELNEKFRKYFFRVRFTKYLVSTVHYCAIDLMRQNHKMKKRNMLIFDSPISDKDTSVTYGELLLSKHATQPSDIQNFSLSTFPDSITNDHLSKAFSSLTRRQQQIITYSYVLCYKDVEISRLLGISQQAVSKARNKALRRLRLIIEEGGDSDGK